MKFIGNLLWLVFGGLEAAFGYFSGGIFLCITIIGIPLGIQVFKLGLLCLWPFGAKVRLNGSSVPGCVVLPLTILWLFTGGIAAFVTHVLSGILLCITIIGIPFGNQHFKMARLALFPFGKDVELHL